MPSPIGHALGGVVFGWLATPSKTTSKTVVFGALTFAALGIAPDLDFLAGNHSRQSHSVGAIAMVFVLALSWAAWRRESRLVAAGGGPARFALACAFAYGSHILFDWMGNDTTPPIGIMALWPFTDAFYQSNLFVFEAISRRWWLEGFWRHNVLAVLRELLILLPALGLIWITRLRKAPAGRR